jgi:hypothetical protein
MFCLNLPTKGKYLPLLHYLIVPYSGEYVDCDVSTEPLNKIEVNFGLQWFSLRFIPK